MQYNEVMTSIPAQTFVSAELYHNRLILFQVINL